MASPPNDPGEAGAIPADDNAGVNIAAHNNGAPIHRLPPELLMAILYHSRRSLKDIRLAHVCRHWRALVCAMPEFWASMLRHLDLTCCEAEAGQGLPEGLSQHCLALSAPRPIKLWVLIQGERERELLAPHSARIVQLSVRLMRLGGSQALGRLLQAGLPNLQVLRIDHYIYAAHDLLEPLPALYTCPLPSLRELFVPQTLIGMSHLIAPSVEHLVYHGTMRQAHEFAQALNNGELCARLHTLTFDIPKPDLFSRIMLVALSSTLAQNGRLRTPGLRRLILRGASYPSEVVDILSRFGGGLDHAPHITLNFNVNAIDLQSVFEAPTLLGRVILPAITRLYLGRTSARAGRSHIALRGYSGSSLAPTSTSSGGGHTVAEQSAEIERLEIAMWREEAMTRPALSRLLGPFSDTRAASGVATLTVDLPRLPLPLARTEWGQPWAVGAVRRSEHQSQRETTGASWLVPPPRGLHRLELLAGTSEEAKMRFVRWVVYGSVGRVGWPPPSALTICWVLDVGSKRGYEERARKEVAALERLVQEFDQVGWRLGRLEIYGTLQVRNIFTRLGDEPMDRQRCLQIVGPHLSRLRALVDEVVV
ncbi:hypothetical protein C8Q77DRAFT_341697 [Trametes polyzona]|nr:hypothetical protein C8Q77DRAFT_341697 [Trametes polyzona]